MLSAIDKYLFFIASFSPLWFIMTVRYGIENYNQPYTCIGIIVVIIIVLPSILLTIKKFSDLRNSSNSKMLQIKESREITMQYIPYVLSYLFPILVEIDGISTLFAVIAAMILVGILYVKTRMVLINPALILAGFRIYETNVESYTRPINIISKKPPQNNHSIKVRDMDHDLCIEQKD